MVEEITKEQNKLDIRSRDNFGVAHVRNSSSIPEDELNKRCKLTNFYFQILIVLKCNSQRVTTKRSKACNYFRFKQRYRSHSKTVSKRGIRGWPFNFVGLRI